MFEHWPLLSIMIWLPIAGGLLTLLVGRNNQLTFARTIALVIALFTLIFSIPLYWQFDTVATGWQYVEKFAWLPSYGIHYYLGIDGFSLLLIILTNYTMLLVLLASFRTVHKRSVFYLANFLIMQGIINGVFAALDSILFYVFWEAMLIPMYLSIGIWGSQNRSFAAIKFFLVTFVGSALLLVALLYLGVKAGSFAIEDFYPLQLARGVQLFLFVGFFMAFAIKIPMWPLHTWLPLAHTEAPAGGSIILAALLLKIGAYGFIRFSMPILPDASQALAWTMVVLSLIAIVYVGLVAIAQSDMKKLIAYSSVAHMGFVTLGLFAVYLIIANTGDRIDAQMSLEGGVVQMISHAFGAGALFLAFGILYDQMHTRRIKDFGGIATTMPVFASFFMVFAMSNVALPGTSGFVGEFMVLVSSFKANIWITAVAATTLVIGAVYTLSMFKRVFYGQVTNPQVAALKDIGWQDTLLFVLLTVTLIGIGLYPAPLLKVMHTSVGQLLELSMQTKVQ